MDLHEKAQVVITEINEGEEKSMFWDALGEKDRTIYHSLLSGML